MSAKGLSSVRLSWELAGAHWIAGAPDRQELVTLALEGHLAGRGVDVVAWLEGAELGMRRGIGRVSLERGVLRYRLDFGGGWTLAAEQRLSFWGSPMPLSVVNGSLSQGEAVRRLRLRFDPRSDLLDALMSLRLDH